MPGNQASQNPLTPLSLEQEFLILTGNNIRRNPLPVFIALVLVAFVAYGSVASVWIITWLLLVSISLFGRAAIIRKWLNDPSKSDKQRVQLIYAANLTNGLVSFLGLSFFPFVSAVDAAFLTVIYGTLSIGVTVGNAGLPKATYPYVITLQALLSLLWIVFPHAESGNYWKSYLLSSLLFLMIPTLLGVSKDIYRLFSSSVEMRQKFANINNQLSQALSESQAANAAKTRFLAAASHDLRQPVHTLSLLTAALISRNSSSTNNDERITEITQTMDSSLQSLAVQLDSLLDISKLDAGIITPHCEDIDVIAIAKRMEQEFLPLANEKHLSLSVNLPESATAFTDNTLLERLLRNLMANAIKYTETGHIDLSIVCDKDIHIHLKDTGIGIAKDQQKLVFEEFYQVGNQHRDRSKGLGLGLSIVSRLCKLLDIKLDLQSNLGQGSEFTLHLRRSAVVNNKEFTKERAHSLNALSVLVIDDEADIRLATRAYLEALDCKVFLAEGSEEALEIAKSNPLELVIADLRLRDDDNGIAALKAIRNIHSNIPAILVTGDTAPDRLREASRANAKLLHKPIYSDQLQVAIEEVLHRETV